MPAQRVLGLAVVGLAWPDLRKAVLGVDAVAQRALQPGPSRYRIPPRLRIGTFVEEWRVNSFPIDLDAALLGKLCVPSATRLDNILHVVFKISDRFRWLTRFCFWRAVTPD